MRHAPRSLAYALVLVAVTLALSCGTTREKLPSNLVPTAESPNRMIFEPDGTGLVVGSTIPADRPAVLEYTIVKALAKGTRIVVSIPTAVGEETDSLWSIPTLDQSQPGAVRLLDANGAAMIEEAGRSLGGSGRIVVRLDRAFVEGDRIRIALTGQVPRTALYTPFRVYEVDGETGAVSAVSGPIPPIFAEPAATVWMVLPSDLAVGEEAVLHLTALDRFGNVDTRFSGTVTFDAGDGAPAQPVTFTAMNGGGQRADVRFAHEGTGRIQGHVTLASGEQVVASNPVRVTRAAPALRRYFGDPHFHTGSDVSKLTTPGGDHRGHFVVSENAYHYLRDVAGLDWGSSAEHDTGLTAETWLANQKRVDALDEPGHFVTLFGYEWTPNRRVGHHVVIFEDGPSAANPVVAALTEKVEKGVATVAELITALRASGRRVLLIPHMMQPFPNGDPDKDDRALAHEIWDGPAGTQPGAYVFDDLRRVAEIYSHHNDDLTAGDYRQTYEDVVDQPQMFELGVKNPWSLQHAWATGHRMGVIGGSDNHLGTPGMNDYAPTVQHHAGLAVVLAPELTRAAIFDALYARRCYATTGPKIWLDFTIDGEPMGSELERSAGARLAIAAEVAGTAPLEAAEIVALRNGDFVTIRSAALDGKTSTASLATSLTFDAPTIVYFRIRQTDGEMAWSSPVWVD